MNQINGRRPFSDHIGLTVVVFAAGCLSLTGTTDAGTTRHDRTLSQHDFLDDPFPGVGKVLSGGGGCSGTTIGENIVITAAHCVDSISSPSDVFFTFNGSTGWNADHVAIHPSWDRNELVGDLALIRFPQAFASPTFVADIFDGTFPFENQTEVGKVTTIVGYGLTGNGLTGTTGPFGTRHAGHNTLDEINFNGRPGTIAVDFDRPGVPSESSMGSSSPLNFEYMIASGDSGGGWFTNIPDILGDPQSLLIGVNSFITVADGSLNSDYGDVGVATRVLAYADWINNYVDANEIHGTQGCIPQGLLCIPIGPIIREVPIELPASLVGLDQPIEMPNVEEIPEPTSVGLVVLGGLLLLRRTA